MGRVVVVGGGFAGLAAARKVRSEHDLVLVDRREAFEFLPNAHEVVSREKKPDALRIPLAPWVERRGGRFIRGEVTGVQPDRRVVELAGEGDLAYDVLVVAIGADVAGARTPGARRAVPLRSVEDAVRIRDRLDQLAGAGRAWRVVVIGGGFIGVEAAGEILRRHGGEKDLAIAIVEPGERLLPRLSKKVARVIAKEARRAGVDVRLRERVAAVEEGAVVLEGGNRLEADLVIWAAGVAPPALLAASGLAGEDGWAAVDETLVSRRWPDVLVAGDAAAVGGLAKQAYHAIRMGRRAGANANRLLAGRRPKRFDADDESFVVTFGDLTTVYADDGGVDHGAALAGLREYVYQREMARFDDGAGRAASKRQRRRIRKAFDSSVALEALSELTYRWFAGR